MRRFFWSGLAFFLMHLVSLDAISAIKSGNCELYADILVWSLRESGTENWAEVITVQPGPVEISTIQPVNFEWNTGFRLGVGFECDPWETRLSYTRFHTTGDAQVCSVPNSVFSAFLGNFYVDNPQGTGIKGLAYERASIHWVVDFNIFDFVVGCECCMGTALSFIPYAGVKGGWIHQSIYSTWQNPSPPSPPLTFVPFNVGNENLTNNFWGLGPSGGVILNCRCCGWSDQSITFFGDFSGAIMYGHWSFSDHYSNDADQVVDIRLSDLNSGATMVRTCLGLRWDFCSPWYGARFFACLGFEMQLWMNQLQYYTLDTGRLSNVLTLQGGTLAFGVEF